MKLSTLHTIRRVSAVLGMVPGVFLLLVGLRLAALTFQYGWEMALDEIRLSAVGPEHRRLVYKGGGFPDVVIDPEVRREVEEKINLFHLTLVTLAVGSFFCFRWAKAEIARTRGSPPAKD